MNQFENMTRMSMGASRLQTTQPTERAENSGQYIFLGGFRFLLALAVFLNHAGQYTPLADAPIEWGGLGVWLFYVVSGYVIFSAHDLFYRGQIGRFLANRCLRIYPTVWLCLLISLGMYVIARETHAFAYPLALDTYGIDDLLLSLSVIGGFLTPDAWVPLSPAATLTIEMKFYVIAAVLFAIAPHTPLGEDRFLFAAGILFLLLYIFIELTGGQYRFYGALRYGPLFVMGAAAYQVHRSRWKSRGALCMLGISYVFTLHFCLSMADTTEYIGFGFHEISMRTAALLSFLFAVLLVMATIRISGPLKTADRAIGDLTYPFYLVQSPLIDAYLATNGVTGMRGFVILLVSVTLASIAINLLIERPLLALRRRWRGQAL